MWRKIKIWYNEPQTVADIMKPLTWLTTRLAEHAEINKRREDYHAAQSREHGERAATAADEQAHAHAQIEALNNVLVRRPS
jgi:hypothetical protein